MMSITLVRYQTADDQLCVVDDQGRQVERFCSYAGVRDFCRMLENAAAVVFEKPKQAVVKKKAQKVAPVDPAKLGKIDRIRLYRDKNHCSLLEAKYAVEADKDL